MVDGLKVKWTLLLLVTFNFPTNHNTDSLEKTILTVNPSTIFTVTYSILKEIKYLVLKETLKLDYESALDFLRT